MPNFITKHLVPPCCNSVFMSAVQFDATRHDKEQSHRHLMRYLAIPTSGGVTNVLLASVLSRVLWRRCAWCWSCATSATSSSTSFEAVSSAQHDMAGLVATAMDVARATAHLHAQNIIHGDLKVSPQPW